MAAREEEFIAGKDLDDLYALLDNGFFDEDVDFEKDLAAVIAESHEANFCCNECSKVCKTQRGLRDTKIQNTAPVEVVVVFQLAAKQLLKRNYMQMYCFGLSIMSVQKAVSMTCIYLKRVEIFFRNNTLYLHLKTLFNCYKN